MSDLVDAAGTCPIVPFRIQPSRYFNARSYTSRGISSIFLKSNTVMSRRYTISLSVPVLSCISNALRAITLRCLSLMNFVTTAFDSPL
ncbi:hypothetical protein Y024_4793 [Burkholderia pseudomallei TSV44]|nr:hypothetical protein X992_5335 [Burkholderia pseudomallei MSHR5492]KGX55404.1 hypothetical protein Y024_4793 [Burkholderia pseudomallei TSV44]